MDLAVVGLVGKLLDCAISTCRLRRDRGGLQARVARLATTAGGDARVPVAGGSASMFEPQRSRSGMIARHWRGTTRRADADAYERLLLTTVLPGIRHRQIAGYRGAYLYRGDVPDGVEFVTTMLFDTIASVRAFAGDDYETAVVPAAARALLAHFASGRRTTRCCSRRTRRPLTGQGAERPAGVWCPRGAAARVDVAVAHPTT